MNKIYLIWRIDFDSMENREPITRRLLGYARDHIERDQLLVRLRSPEVGVKTYRGFEGGWGGAETTYPKFEAQEVKPILRENNVDSIPCDGTCLYCRAEAPLLEISVCVCDCNIHTQRRG